jgi:hypothetical protein
MRARLIIKALVSQSTLLKTRFRVDKANAIFALLKTLGVDFRFDFYTHRRLLEKWHLNSPTLAT